MSCAKFCVNWSRNVRVVAKIQFCGFRDFAKKNYGRKWAWPMPKDAADSSRLKASNPGIAVKVREDGQPHSIMLVRVSSEKDMICETPIFFSNDVKVNTNMCVKFGLDPMSNFGFFWIFDIPRLI